jgi:aspartate carbamoyltransferase catalytic subunit
LEDTVRCLECYADALVLRHPEIGAAARAATACFKPVLNAGDGVGEHPTQALLDLYTIRCELWAQCQAGAAAGVSRAEMSVEELCGSVAPPVRKLVAGQVVALVGDLKHGRTVHSLAQLLGATYGDALHLCLVSPPQLAMPPGVLAGLTSRGCGFEEHGELSSEVLAKADVLYVTRVQKERFASLDE